MKGQYDRRCFLGATVTVYAPDCTTAGRLQTDEASNESVATSRGAPNLTAPGVRR